MAEPVVREPLPGGEAPDVGKLLNETIAEFTDDIGPYLLAGLGHTLVVMPVVFGAIILLYLGMIFGMFGGMIGIGVVGAMVGSMLGETAGGLSMLVSQLIFFLLIFLAIVAFGAGLGAVLAPFNASLTRAVAAYQRGEGELGFNAAFSTAGQDIMKVVAGAVLIASLAMVLLMFCYIPVLIVPFVFGFFSPLIYLHGLGPLDAFRTSLAHFQAHMSYHLTIAALLLVLGMVASYVPVLGPAFLSAFHVRAYRAMFGDGVEPVLA